MVCFFPFSLACEQFSVVVYNPLVTESPLVLWVPISEETVNSHLTVVDNAGASISAQVGGEWNGMELSHPQAWDVRGNLCFLLLVHGVV